MTRLLSLISFFSLLALFAVSAQQPDTAGNSPTDTGQTAATTLRPESQESADATSAANPQMKAVLDQLAALGPKPIETLQPQDARRQPSINDAVTQLMQAKGNIAPEKLPPVGKVEMKSIPGPDQQQIPVRVYTPSGQGPHPVIVYVHGGGWVLATIDTYDASCRTLSTLTNAVVVSIEYRKAPEHKFPAAHEDSYAAFQYVANHASDFSGDPARVVIAGESAGGNMATAVCIMAKQRNGKMPIHQVLIYPVTNHAFDTPSYAENAHAKPLNKAMMHWFFEQYLNSPSDGENVLVSPLRASDDQLRGLPPATIVTAQIDPLRSEGEAYGQKLKAAGVDVAMHNYEGVTHEFFGMALVVDAAKDANQFVAERLKDAFKNTNR